MHSNNGERGLPHQQTKGLNVEIKPDDKGNVLINFSEPINFLAIPTGMATQFALQIIQSAGGRVEVQYTDETIGKLVDAVLHPGLDELDEAERRIAAIEKVKVMLNGAAE